MLTIGVKYCGGCNPEIDRPAVVERLEEELEKRGREVILVTDRETRIDLRLLVNGCKHACLDEEYSVSEESLPVISVRGQMVGSRHVREEDIPEFLIGKIIDLI